LRPPLCNHSRAATTQTLNTRQLPLHHGARLSRHEIPARIGRIVTAGTIFISIAFEHVFRPEL
jgi:hypothetical protein